jgi:hypothetical protein
LIPGRIYSDFLKVMATVVIGKGTALTVPKDLCERALIFSVTEEEGNRWRCGAGENAARMREKSGKLLHSRKLSFPKMVLLPSCLQSGTAEAVPFPELRL